MAKKNVHRRNRTSGTDSSSSKDDEFVSSSSSSEEVVKYLDLRSYKRLKEKVFIWIDSDLKDVFEIDVKITWAEQKDNIVTKLLPALHKLVDKRYKVTNKELLDMLYGRWRSRHREYNIRIQGEEKIKSNKRRTAKNSKMQDKKKRRVIATNYLIQNNDKYINRYPKEDLVNILKETGYHSEEWKETDPESEWPVVIPVCKEKIFFIREDLRVKVDKPFKANMNISETQILGKNWFDINEESADEPIFKLRAFELNEADMIHDENSEYESEYDDFESENEENFNNDYESDIRVEQSKPKNLTPCVLIDKIDSKIQRCKNLESFRTLWQLVGIWQVDSNEVLEANDRENGCSKYLTWSLLGKNIQVVCNGQHKCPALEECNPICKPVSKDIKNSRYICSECYELEGGHFHIKPGKGKLLATCVEQKYHDHDIKKNLEIIARWLLYVKDNKNEEYQKKVLRIFLPSYFQFLSENYNLQEANTEIQANQIQPNELNITTFDMSNYSSIPILLKLPTFFMVQTLTLLIGYAFPYFNLWLSVVLSSLCRRPKLISFLHALLTKCSVIGHTNHHERRLEKIRMQNINPIKRLKNGNNVYNLAVIDNIDFKEASFGFGNIYDVTHGTSHATLRMVFQSTLPIIVNETPEPIKELNADSHLFRMTQGMYIMQSKIDCVFEKLLDFQKSINEINYNKNLDVDIIEKEILTQCEFGCLILPPNVVILTPAGSPNDDEKIFHATQMYKEEFSLNDNEYLDICADEAIFRRLIKSRTRWEKIRPILGQWHTSKEMLGVLLTIFLSYGIFHFAAAIGVCFLDKLQAVVDYRSTRRVLELIWIAVGIAIHIYAKKKNINVENISNEPNENICVKVWYFYYKYFTMWKSHLIGIRIGNYELQHDSLTAFAPLFPAAGKNNYTTSVAHFLKGHYSGFDEALEMYGVGYVKKNIIGNVINQENLNLQIRATQEEKERIDALLNEFLDPYNYNRKDRKVDNRIDPLYKLVENLIEIFEISNYTEHELFKNNSPSQLTQEGLEKLNNAYNEGLKRIKEVYCQEVIKTERINTKRRRHLEVVKTDIRSINKSIVSLQKRKVPKGNNESTASDPAPKRKRIVTTNEDKEILKPLLLKETMPTEEEFSNILVNLPSTWDIQRVKRYYLNNKKKT
ncbi:hypothetical protein RhiirB3_451730 [Rhizophagus irregularis]|nr:hypothetical protein RhiirB3_451730 [Rhizophagus irregularis]